MHRRLFKLFNSLEKTSSAEDWMSDYDKDWRRFKRYYDNYLDRQGERNRYVSDAAMPVVSAGALGLLGGPGTAGASMLLAAAMSGAGSYNLMDQEAARYALERIHRKVPKELQGINTHYYG